MLPKGPYSPKDSEKEILEFWLKNKFYAPEFVSKKAKSTAFVPQKSGESKEESKRETYTNILPPPNANGNLHLGHMSGYAYQDLMGRYQRMIGKKVLLLPGKDHAGIQTEVVYERELEKKGIDKKALGRDKFYKQCYDFCMENSAIAREQEKSLGLSADFDRELFTLDPQIVDEVLKTFIDMYDDGLVYRDKRLINWCVRCQSALADIDTEYKDSKGSFVYFKYGFLEPEKDALSIKKKYSSEQQIEWIADRSTSQDGKEQYPFIVGEPVNSLEIETGKVVVYCIGYNTETIKKGDHLQGKPVAIMMRLDKKFRLILANPEFDGDLDLEIKKIWTVALAKKREAGVHFIRFDQYPDDKFYTNGFVMGTVRPETKFGDTGIAVNPKDERYTDYVGKEFDVLTINGPAKIKIIADNAVDKDFGTGALKITPAHAKEDWDIATRHPECFPEKQCINFDGKLNHLCGKYEGMKVKEARAEMLDEMREKGILVMLEEEYENRIQICERCKHPIEPLVSYQWFLDTRPLKAKAKQLVNDGFTTIMPEGKQKVFQNWMDSEEDWCITRQLWWGYRVPAWYKTQPKEYITETGEVKEQIDGKIMNSPEDYKKVMAVSRLHPGIKLAVIRHGEIDANKDKVIQGQLDPALNETGRNQAERMAESLNKNEYDLIISSPLVRAMQTAEILSKKLGLEIITNDLLKERNMGELEGKTHTEAINMGYNEKFQETIKGGESIQEVEERVEEFISFVKKNFPNKKILIITHMGIIRVLSRKLQNTSTDESRELKIENCSLIIMTIPTQNWIQDEDVFDTWFSSGQWPYVTLKAHISPPEKGELEGVSDFEAFYPTQVMETGWDIIIFWVTRMMLLCPYKASKDKIQGSSKPDKLITPFKDVYLHGLVLDKNGVKMSKSKGNGIDPFEMMEKYGTDALRLSFVHGNKVGQNYRLYEEKISNFRNFCNKIWNVSKFILMNIENSGINPVLINKEDLKFEKEDIDFQTSIEALAEKITKNMDSFQFGVAINDLYDSIWHDFADIYIELVKVRTYTKDKEGNAVNTSPEALESRKSAIWSLWYSLDSYLRLLHPFMPFITEKIWQELPKVEEESETLMYAKWPSRKREY